MTTRVVDGHRQEEEQLLELSIRPESTVVFVGRHIFSSPTT